MNHSIIKHHTMVARKKKKTTRKRKKSSSHKTRTPAPKKVKEPDYMVQVGEPTALRRDLLEALREVILFMQSYEQFVKVQEEKVEAFSQLKEHTKELNSLVNSKLRVYLPQGKLDAIQRQAPKPMSDHEIKPRISLGAPAAKSSFPNPQAFAKAAIKMPDTPVKPKEHSELDDLEGQLKDIEKQLKGLN